MEHIEVKKIITGTDLKSNILVLSPLDMKALCQYKGQKLWIKDSMGCELFHLCNDNDPNALRFSGLKKWYGNRNIIEGTKLQISFDEDRLILNIEYVEDEPSVSETEQYTYTADFPLDYEKELKTIIKLNPDCIEPKLKLITNRKDGEYKFSNGGVCDLLFADKNNNYLVVELKNKKASTEVIDQISKYIDGIKEDLIKDANAKVRGIIITPEYDEKLEQAVKSRHDELELRYFKFNLEFSTVL